MSHCPLYISVWSAGCCVEASAIVHRGCSSGCLSGADIVSDILAVSCYTLCTQTHKVFQTVCFSVVRCVERLTFLQSVWIRTPSCHGYHFASVAQWGFLSSSAPSTWRTNFNLSVNCHHVLPLSCNMEFLQVYLTLSLKCFFCSLTNRFPSFLWQQRICLGKCEFGGLMTWPVNQSWSCITRVERCLSCWSAVEKYTRSF